RVRFLDHDNAKELFHAREKTNILHGFTDFKQIEMILDPTVFKKLIDFIIRWFSSIMYGDWGDPIPLQDEGGSFSVVHAAVLKTGKVIMIERACGVARSKTPLWNPTINNIDLPLPVLPENNLYCSGHCFLSNGKLLVIGGGGESYQYPKDRCFTFDPDNEIWESTTDLTDAMRPVTKLQEQRWYPTVLNLGEEPGRILIASGDISNFPLCNILNPEVNPPMKIEIYSENTGKFEYLYTNQDRYFRPTYPGLHPLPGGEVFFAPVGFATSGESSFACAGNQGSALLHITGSTTGTWTAHGGKNDRTKGMSVLLMNDTPPFVQVLTVGGGDNSTNNTFQLIDLSTLNGPWDAKISLPSDPVTGEIVPRVHPNLVLLPDGTVFMAGGADAAAACWIFDPNDYSWSKMDKLTYQRRYHSFAILLPTGEIMASGGEGTFGADTVEIFKPPYFFKGTRPVIESITPDPIHHGQNFTITTANPSEIKKVTLVRPMAVTHQTDTEQRVIKLCYYLEAENKIIATAPNGR
ncbi:MAG: galactose oxidase-like domain-containing protein, partial [Candidatus Heimdallarchaeota archaeon]